MPLHSGLGDSEFPHPGNRPTSEQTPPFLGEASLVTSYLDPVLNSYISISIPNLNGLNAPIKTQTGKLDKKPKPISMLHPDSSHMQGYPKTQRDGGRFINQMERKNK